MNLNTARTESRAKEVGVRKVIGASRNQIIWQVIIESLLISTVALILAVLFLLGLLPVLNKITGKILTIPWNHLSFWMFGVGISLDAGFLWKGKDPGLQQAVFATISVSVDFGKTIQWKIAEGRDFSKDFSTDSSSLILNEAAVKFMGLKRPIGETITWNKSVYHVIGVVQNIIMSSPFESPTQTIYYLNPSGNNSNDPFDFLSIRLNSVKPFNESISKVEAIYKKYCPDEPYNYKLVTNENAYKFENEDQMLELATSLTLLALFVSCLGLLAMTAFITERREKELGIRKILGASLFSLLGLLIKEFILLIIFSCLISIPLSWMLMDKWLQNYSYRIEITWPIYVITALAVISISMLTISYLCIKSAQKKPVQNLRVN